MCYIWGVRFVCPCGHVLEVDSSPLDPVLTNYLIDSWKTDHADHGGEDPGAAGVREPRKPRPPAPVTEVPLDLPYYAT